MDTLAHPGAAAHRVRVAVIALLALLVAFAAASSARAAGAVGPVDTSGIPTFYQDATGLQLAPCLLGPPSCVGTLPDLNAPDGEAFYWSANASLTDPSGAKFTIVNAVEAANLNGGIITFGRIRVTGKGLTPNTTYSVVGPYGSVNVTSDAGGIAKDTAQVGCAAAPCAFDAALGSPVFGGFLQWDPTFGAPPIGFIGDNVTPHKVIGSPVAVNSVTITGGGLSLFTDLFVVQGQLAAGATPPGALAPATPPAPHLLAADDTGASNTDGITKVAAPTIVGSTTPLANVAISVDGAATATGKALADGSYSIKLPAALATGTHPITVVASNPTSGAASLASPTFNLVIDTLAPAIPSVPKTVQASAAALGATFTGSADADSMVSLFADGDAQAIGSGAATGGFYSIKANALSVGLHHVTASASDVAGNVSAQSAALALPVGAVAGVVQPPSLSSTSDSGISSSDGITNVSRPTFIGSVPFTTGTVKLFADGVQVGTATAGAGAYSLESSKLSDGQHLITVIATDATGLESPASAPLRITIDTVAPAAPSKPSAAASALAFAPASVSLSGTAETGSSISVYLDGRNAASSSAFGGSWSASLLGVAAGSHEIDATATDLAGNQSGHSEALAVTVGVATPPAVVAQPRPEVVQGPSIVALGAVPVAKLHGKVATVKATVNVGAAAQLSVSAADAKGAPLTLLRGSRLGSSTQKAARASSLRSALRKAGRVRIELHLGKAQVAKPGVYVIVVDAADAAGHTTTMKVAFRVA